MPQGATIKVSGNDTYIFCIEECNLDLETVGDFTDIWTQLMLSNSSPRTGALPKMPQGAIKVSGNNYHLLYSTVIGVYIFDP